MYTEHMYTNILLAIECCVIAVNTMENGVTILISRENNFFLRRNKEYNNGKYIASVYYISILSILDSLPWSL